MVHQCVGVFHMVVYVRMSLDHLKIGGNVLEKLLSLSA